MKCEEIRGFADLYIDREFDTREAALFEEHLNGCPECRREVAGRAVFAEALRRKAGPVRMPVEARERITAAVMRAAEMRGRSMRSLALPMAVAASAVVLVLAAAGYLRFLAPSGEVGTILDESVAVHEAGLPLDLDTGDLEKVIGFLTRQDEVEPAPPLSEDENTQLQGVGVARIGRSKAILFRYVHNGQPVSVVRLPRRLVPADRFAASGRPAEVLYMGARNGHAVTVYRTPRYMTTLVGDVPEKDLQQLVPRAVQ